MNDNEFAELLGRERIARSFGWTRNDYTCERCIAEGRSVMGSTYLDWPNAIIDGKPLCDRHGFPVVVTA